MLHDRVNVSTPAPVPEGIHLSSNESGYFFTLALKSLGRQELRPQSLSYLYFFHTRKMTTVPTTKVPRTRPMRIAMMGMVCGGSEDGKEGRVRSLTLALNPDPALVHQRAHTIPDSSVCAHTHSLPHFRVRGSGNPSWCT